MNAQAIRKQLVVAIIMVMVAAIALGTSTYAWFVNNASVQAQGMSVNATADSSLLIKGADVGQVFGSVGTTTIAQTTMKPATSADGLAFAKLASDVKVEQSGSAAATWTGAAGAFAAGDLEAATGETYVETATYTLKSVSEAANIYVSGITLSEDDPIFTATRVSVTITDSTGSAVTKIYNPMSGTLLDGKVGSGTTFALVDAPTYTNTTAASLWSLTANTEYTVTVRIWFEGQDTACFSDNIAINGASFTLAFTRNNVA